MASQSISSTTDGPTLSDRQHRLAQYLTTLREQAATDPEAQRRLDSLQSQVVEVEEPFLQGCFDQALTNLQGHIGSHLLKPFPAVVERNSHPQAAEWTQRGFEELAKGTLAMIVLAGGQGTRLGSPLPKGLYNIGLPSGKSLFQLQAEKLRAMQVAAAAYQAPGSSGRPSIPYYVLTSEATETATRTFFEQHHYFGLKPDEVHFIEQGSCPSLTPEGELLLNSPSELTLSPNGNGGVYEALAKSGAIDDMKARGIKAVMISGIDNGLLRLLDPEFMGMLVAEDLEAALKVVPKAHPDERVGVLGLINEKPAIIEYSEIDPADARSTDDQGKLRFNTGNICIHGFSLDFLERCAKEYYRQMPYHLAFKAVPYWDPVTHQHVHPTQPNAYKLERFIFDVLPFCNKIKAMEVSRADEFAPVKNAPGAAADTPETARTLISNMYRRWLAQSGAIVAGPADALVEISPLLSWQGEGLAEFAGRTIEAPCYLESPASAKY